jgi:aryl-alcohol dehydrogenase-like predicted oxidoreductase
MQTVTLGRTGAQVSVAGLGCGGASRLGMTAGADIEQAASVVRRAIELGVTFIDTARNYGTEEAVGLGIRGRRDEVFLSTKSSAGRGERMFTAAELSESLDGSLRRLGTDHVDVFHLHGLDAGQYDYCAEVLVPEMRRQQAAGKIRFVGATEHFGADTAHRMLTRALPDDHFDVVMVGFNLLNPSARTRVFPGTLKHAVGTLVMFAVRRSLSQPGALREVVTGLIERREVDASKIDAADPLGFLRERADIASLTEAAYRFCRHEPGAEVILTGTGNLEHLEANLAAIQGPPLPPEITERLRGLFGAVDTISGN